MRGSSKAAVSIAALAVSRGRAVTLIPDDPVLAPELDLPGRFRLVADAQRAGLRIAAEPGDGDTVITVRRHAGSSPPALGPEVHVIGDARGPGGLAAAFTEAAEVAGRIQ